MPPAPPRLTRFLERPGIRVFAKPGTWAFIAVVSLLFALGYTALVLRPDLLDPTAQAGDPWNYLAAAERLRDGHPLYALGPGDRIVLGYPDAYPLPLLAPPVTAVLWLPFLVLGPEPAMIAWAVGGFVATVVTTLWVIARGGVAVRALVVVLAYPLASTALSGNVNAYLLPLLVVSWLGLRPEREVAGGAATGLATAARLGPSFVGLVYLVRRRWIAASAAAGVFGAILLASVAIAGIDTWIRYADATYHGSIEPSGLSVPGMLGLLGLGPPLTTLSMPAFLFAAAVAIVALRHHPRAAFVVAIVASVYATPVVRMEFWALLLAAAAPWVLPDPVTAGPARDASAAVAPATPSG